MILLLDHSKSPCFNSTCLNLFLRLSFEALSRSMWCIMYACTFDQLAFEWWKKPCMLQVVPSIYSTMEFVTNQKGGQSLLWNGSRFALNRKMANGTMYWRCSRRSYPTRITTQGDELLQQTNGHNHAVDPTESHMEQIKSNPTYLLTFSFLLTLLSSRKYS